MAAVVGGRRRTRRRLAAGAVGRGAAEAAVASVAADYGVDAETDFRLGRDGDDGRRRQRHHGHHSTGIGAAQNQQVI